MAYSKSVKVFCGNASRALAEGICAHLEIPLGKAAVSSFSDGEIKVQIGENIRGSDVFICNSTSPPVNSNLMEMLILIDAARRASAERVTAVVPHFGHRRQDRKDRPPRPIPPKFAANFPVGAGALPVLIAALPSAQNQGLSSLPWGFFSAALPFA